jgi:hypothetical protein
MTAQPTTTPTPAVERTVREYHFSLGDSTTGPVGYAARVAATTATGAVERLRELLDEELAEIHFPKATGGEYLTVYFNLMPVTAADADEPECAACGEYLPEEVDVCPRCAQG